MTGLFSRVLNMSLSAGLLICAVIVARLILKGAPKWSRALLWGIVAVRLICPFSIESALSLIPSAELLPAEATASDIPSADSAPPPVEVPEETSPETSPPTTTSLGDSAKPVRTLMPAFSAIWMSGAILMLAYSVFGYARLKLRVRTAVLLRDNIYQSERVTSPFTLGLVYPKIYVPFGLEPRNLEQVAAHERAHIRRLDNWWKPFGFLLLSVYWFNPLVWLAYTLFCRDIELACDERVLRGLDREGRADYSQALLSLGTGRRGFPSCPMHPPAFGEIGVKARVKAALNYRKPPFWLAVAAAVVCAALAVFFLTDPLTQHDYLRLAERESTGSRSIVRYETDLTHQRLGGEVWVEQWSGGECVSSAPMAFSEFVGEFDIIMTMRRSEDNTLVGTNIQLQTDQYGGSLLTYFQFPYDVSVLGWSFCTRDEGVNITPVPESEFILTAMAADIGKGIRSFTCEALESEPDRLTQADYMLVVRARFDSPAAPPVEQSETIPAQILTLDELITLSEKGYDLGWEDFEAYEYIEGGSGLYIRVYPTEGGLFNLSIGGAGPNREPMYMYLSSSDGSDTYIDIRDGGAEQFIAEHIAATTATP